MRLLWFEFSVYKLIYDFAGSREWTRVKTIGPVPEGRYGHAAAMVGSKFFVFGGQKDDGGFMNDLVWFDLQKRRFLFLICASE